MQNVHTKPIKGVNPLQCNQCQDEFTTMDEFQSHELNVDCAVTCPDCGEVFPTKASRQEHQKESHSEEEIDPVLRELDDNSWKLIKDTLKFYTDIVKGKKGKSADDPNTDRENWVQANIDRFEAGRSKTKFNARLELGQWYTIFMTLAPNMKVSEHPCKSSFHLMLETALN